MSLLIWIIFISSRNWRLSDSMSELAERLAADGVIIEECDIPPGIIPKVPLSAFYLKHNHLPVPVSRHFRTDYSTNLKEYSPTQHQYSLFPRQSCKYGSKCNLIFKPLTMEFYLAFRIFRNEISRTLIPSVCLRFNSKHGK